MINIIKQVFLPASKGFIKSAPSSLIDDGAFQEVNNVRFADGYVEKVKAFTAIADFGEKIFSINIMRKNDGTVNNLIHTTTKLYTITEDNPSGINLMPDGYSLSDIAYISSQIVFDDYIFCSLGNPIMYWDGVLNTCKKLEGTYNPSEWASSRAYIVGDTIKPITYSGYIYKCTQAGTSGTTEPTWLKDLSTIITDGSCRWVGIGSLEIEGDSAKSLQAQCIENFKGFVCVANTEEDGQSYPHRLRWSQWQNPRLWHNNEDGSGMAGYIDCDDTPGKIMAIKKLGDYLFVYKEDGLIVISYTGGDTIFSKELVTTKAGLIGPQAIVELPHAHIFISSDNIYSFDGSTVTPIGDTVKNYIISIVNPSSLLKIFGYYNKDSGDVVFAFDSTLSHDNNRDRAIVYNTSTKTWSVRDMNMTAMGEYSQVFDREIDTIDTAIDEMDDITDASAYLAKRILTFAGDGSGKLYRLEGYNDSRGDYEGYVITKTHHMEAPDKIKRLLRIQFHIETQGDYNLVVQVGTSWNSETLFTWSDKFTMGLKSPKPPFVDVDLSARYFAIRFGTVHNNEPFKVLGYTLYYQTRSDE